jgi:LuxR family transcriptional regulator, maltose regulon positive regulatory protein
MADELLRTKLMPPPGHGHLVTRDRLIRNMTDGTRLPLTLVVAPAGSGKTSLVRSWRASDAGQSTPLAWVALDEHDNDPVRFWRYAIAALETLEPDLGESARSYLDAHQGASVQPALVSLINALAELDGHLVLALDDYHVIGSTDIHEQLTFLIENLPATLRLLLISRADPPLPLARWRARGQMLEIRDADLRFTDAEASDLLGADLTAELDHQQVAALTERTEGWAAGLHLAALALRSRDDPDDFLQTFSGSHHYVLTYLAEDVIDHQPPEVQTFLLNTSILDQLSGSLCDAVNEGQGGADVLTYLVSINLFTTPLDDSGTWYRYHHLFADVLRHRLRQRHPEIIPELHRRASAWYNNNGLTTQAIDHALKAGDTDLAARLIQSVSRDTLTRGEARLVRRWLDSLPPETLNRSMRMLLAGGWSQLLTGPVDEVERWITAAENARANDPDVDEEDFLGEVAAMKALVYSFKGKVNETIAQAEEALKHITDADVGIRGLVAMSLGQAHRFNGNDEASAKAYREAIQLGLQSNNLYTAIDSMADLGVVLMRRGKLREANEMFRRAQQELIERNATHLPVAGAVATIWPEILYEMNDAESSQTLAQRGLELGIQGAKSDLILNGHRSLGSAYWLMGRWDEAIEENRRSAEVSRAYGLVHTTVVTEARIAHIEFTRGNLKAAQEWAATYRHDPDLPGFAREVSELMLARICIASGDPGSALTILEPLEQPAREVGRIRSLMPILNLQALAHNALGDQDTALNKLGDSLGYAAPEGFISLFLNEGEAMSALLRVAVAHGIQTSFASELLALFDRRDPTDDTAPGQQDLIEPLSDREQAVLRLMCAGLSAPEIANELYVAASTVRTHLKNIYRKLDVHSRDQAIARAGELNLV